MTPNSLAGLARRPWYESPWRIAGSALASTMALLLLGVVAVLFVVPTVLGGAALTVLTGSMEPTFAPGDIVVVRGIDPADVCADVTVGQIVTFFPEPERPDLITHRVIGKTIGTFDDGTDCRLVTQGDANSEVDPPVSPAQVRGVFVYGVPRLGWVRQWAQQNTQALVVGIAVVTVTYGLWSWLRPPKRSVRVLEAPGGPAPRGALGTEGPPGMAIPASPDLEAQRLELELRQREIALREREVTVREVELGIHPHRPKDADGTSPQA